MKCREAQYWLYSFQPNAAWPSDVVGHLQDCPDCQQLQAQLRQIDTGINQITTPAKNDAPIGRLLDRVAKTPQVSAPAEKPTPRLPGWARIAAYLAGSIALILIGWVLGRYVEPAEVAPGNPVETVKTVFVDKTVEVIKFQDKIVHVPLQSDRSLFTVLLKRNARLVQASAPSDRLDTLLDMADDCRQHALTLIEQGPHDTLPMTIELYGQLLRDGVLVQLGQAAAAERPALQAAARGRLEKMADLPASAMKALPRVLADEREALQKTTKTIIDRVDRPEEALPTRPQKQGAGALAPTSALVQFAITVSSETDPVAKADLCAGYVDRLMPSMRLYLAEEGQAERIQMGQQFGELIQFGVYQPLEVATAKEPEAPVKAHAEQVFEAVGKAVAEMEKNLQQAPDDARQGWQKALEATRPSFEKNNHKGGKGKEGKGPREIRGLLKNIDPARKTVTVMAKVKGKDADYTYGVTREVLSALMSKAPAGPFEVQLRLSDDRRTVIEINAGRNRDDGQKNQK
jgi:hypothetical protein